TNEEFLTFIQNQAAEQGLSNIETLQTAPDHLTLPPHTCDYLFLRNVTHHLHDRVTYFQRLSETLTPEGKVVLIEYDGRGGILSFQKLHKHFVPPQTLIKEMEDAGYTLQQRYEFLSEQSFLIFKRKT
ncbi:MAG: class I SAM-dependent methyltransferase, partial [Candidatus Thermoplasmatota archaeon]|nr:class I SAM-dependent methyltransferase [Candidatus Thermoplasmatota archaeon]